jgi:hypothetical protein
VLIELSGVPATLQLPAFLFDAVEGAGPRLRFSSPAGLKLPGGAKLRLRAAAGARPEAVVAFVAGELVRG